MVPEETGRRRAFEMAFRAELADMMEQVLLD
jgi:hypothetical protein